MSAAEQDIIEQVMSEVQEALTALARDGASHVIDLRRLPHLGPDSYAFLKEALGAGEVSALVSSVTPVEIAETGFPGVWWVTYRRASEDISTVMIEVSFVPNILITNKAQVEAGVRRLAARKPAPQEADRH
jgi:hydrogenase-1 operon protein HyaF